jgi:hypothetical protein
MFLIFAELDKVKTKTFPVVPLGYRHELVELLPKQLRKSHVGPSE